MKIFIGPYTDDDSERQVDIHIDNYDTWSMDHTLAMIILPMLRQLKETKHGAPGVDDSDVPDELKSTSAPPKENDWDTDDNHFKRWDWALDEMIWAFEQILIPDRESQFYSGTSDYLRVPLDEHNKPIGDPMTADEWFNSPEHENVYAWEMIEGPNHTWKVDKEGLDNWSKRLNNGLLLFGKYYQNLWD